MTCLTKFRRSGTDNLSAIQTSPRQTTSSVAWYFFLPVLFLGFKQTLAQVTTVSSPAITSPWTVPATATKIKVEVWGAGGGGGGQLGASKSGSGGGGGGYTSGIFTVLPATITFSQGTGGIAGTTAPSNGGNGGNSSVSFLTNNLTANGGKGGTASGIIPQAGGAGGTASGGTINTSGTAGNTGTTVQSGAGGAGVNGGAGGAARTTAGAGNAGTIAGGGGSGGLRLTGGSNFAGGAGANGKISITYSNYRLTATRVAAAICTGNTASITFTSTSTRLPAGTYTIKYTLSGANTATNTISVNVTGTATTTGTFNTTSLSNGGSTTITINNIESANVGNTIAASNTAAITVNSTPTITTQPVAPAATCSGSGIQTITVAATGGGLTYSWRKGGVALVNGGVISGQGTATLRLTNATAANAGNYDVVITGACTPSVTSNAVPVTINTAPVITTQPVAPTAICAGSGTRTISVAATGTGLTYSWRKAGVAVCNCGVVSGQGTNTLTLTNPTAANAGSYTVVITGTCGAALTSTAVTVTVNAAPAITTQPTTPATTCAGSGTQSLSVVATGTGLTYSWQKGGVAVANGGIISGQGTATLTLTRPTAANAGVYTVVVSGTCTPSVTSNPITVSVNSLPAITTQPVAPAVICTGGGTRTISVTATGTNLTYSWQKAGVAVANGGAISGQGTNTLTLTNPTTANAGAYRVLVGGACTPTVTSSTVAVTVNTLPTITTQPITPATTCSGGGTQRLSVVATGTGLTYSWRKGGVAVVNGGVISGQGTATLTLTRPTVANAGVYTVVITGTCATPVTSNAVTVSVNSLPAISTQPVAPAAVCAGSGIRTISVTATGTNITYTWQRAGVNLTNGAVISGQGTNTLTLTNPTTANAGNYRVLVGGSCTPTKTSATVAVVVNTAAAITAQPAVPAATCSGSGTQTMRVTATGTGLTYSWRKGGVALVNGGVISGQGTNTLRLTSATTANAGIYDVVVTGTCGSPLTSNAITVTIKTAPAITTQPVAPAATCAGSGTQTITVGATGGGLTYSWRKAGVAVVNGGVISGQGTATLLLTNPTAANAGSYTVVVSNSCGAAVTSTAVPVVINTPVAITTQPVAPAATCAGSGTQILTVAATGTGIAYSWRKGGVAVVNSGTISGQGTNTLTLTNPTTSDAGSYDVVVSGTCPSVTSNAVTVTVNAITAITAAAAPVSQNVLMNTAPTNLTLNATGAAITCQWFSNTTNSNSGGTSVGAANGGQTSSYQPPTNTIGTQYYYCVVTGTCGTVTSSAVAVTVANINTWTGGSSSDFSSASNWSMHVVPTGVNDAVIPAGSTPYPELTASLAVNNLTIAPGATLSIGNNTLTINNIVSGTGTITGSDVSNLVIAGNAGTLYFTSGAKNNYLKNFTLNNGASASLGNALNITGGTSLNNEGTLTVSGTATLTTGGFLTIKSNAFGTARVAAGRISGGYISGDVTVERFIRQNASKGWRLLASNTSGQTISQAWQEGQVGANMNNNPGFGIFITKNGTLSAVQAAGFDSVSQSASLFKYNPATDNLDAVPNTNTTQLSAEQGYFLFVRGDRSPYQMGAGAPLTSTSFTTLRSKGSLFQGDQPQQTVLAGQWGCFRNPYASALDLRNVIVGGGMVNAFQVWDPAIGGAFGVGGYQTLNFNGSNYVITPGGGSYGANGSIQNTIESGAAFFVQTTGTDGTLKINESSKASGSQSVFRPESPLSGTESLAYNLYANNTGSTDMVDGGLVFFDQSFSNEVDLLDVKKSPNFKENLGTTKTNTDLVVERRQSPSMIDTIAFSMYGMRQVTYKLELLASNLNYPGMAAFLVDNYTGSSTSLNLNDTTSYSFTVGAAAASRAAGRLKIVFRPMGVLPVTFTSIRAYTQASNIAVEWKVESQVNISRYEIEKSPDGRSFTRAGIQVASLQNAGPVTYTWLDVNAMNTANYYRVKSVSSNGRITYSAIVKVILGKEQPAILVSPNPVVENIVNLQFKNQPGGRYTIRVVNNAGRAVFTTTTRHPGGNSTFVFSLPSTTARGVYLLEVISPDNLRQSLLLYLRN